MEEHYIYKEFEPYLANCSDLEKNYIVGRLINQIIWYDTKAIEKQKKYKFLTIASIILTAAIPVLALFTNFDYGIVATVLITLFGTVSSAILSIINFCEFHKLWIQYRSNCEILKSILHRYFIQGKETSEKGKESNLNLLILNCESYMVKEYRSWADLSHEYKKEQ